MTRRAWALAVLGCTALIIAGTTLLPSDMQSGGSAPSCLFCGERDVADGIRNLILFAPLGVGLALLGIPLLRVAAMGFALSGAIEALQLSIIPGRDASLADLLTNSLGTALGAWLVVTVPRLYGAPGARKERAARWAAAAAWLATAGSAALMLPSLPESRYFGQWNHEFGGRKWEGAGVISATIDTLPIADWELAASPEVRQAMLAGAPIEVRGIAGHPVPRVTPFFQVADHRQRWIFLIGPDRDDLVFRYRTWATKMGFDQPDLRLRGALAEVQAGDTIVIRAWRERGRYCLVLNQRRDCGLGYSAAGGWRLLMHPEHLPRWTGSLIGAAWLALLAAPFASLTGSRRILLVGTAALALAPAVSALLPGVLIPSVIEWLGLPLGVTAGRALGGRLAARVA